MRNPEAILNAARVPNIDLPEKAGPWNLSRRDVYGFDRIKVGWSSYTLLQRVTMGSLHLEGGEVVMEDSRPELLRHMDFWMKASGRVLVTGLGLGCVTRGLLSLDDIEHIDLVEIDENLIRVIGTEFKDNPRITIHHGDAFSIDLPGTWDFAWHDIWSENEKPSLHSLHIDLMARFYDRCKHQGAWAFPRPTARLLPIKLIGSPSHPAIKRKLKNDRRHQINRV